MPDIAIFGVLQQADLFFQEGSSDKEYHIQLMQQGNAYLVTAQWGRRGGPLQAQTKLTSDKGTSSADGVAALHDAEKVYAKVLNEKLAKGYQPEPGQPTPVPAVPAPAPSQTQQPYAQAKPARRKLVTWDDDDELIVQRIQNFGPAPATNTAAATTVVAPANGEKIQTGNVPQLPNMVDEETLEALLNDDAYGMQEKMDGHHNMVDTTHDLHGFPESEKLKVSNKKGILKLASPQFLDQLTPELAGKKLLLDGEHVGNYFYVYDLLYCDGDDLRPLGYEDRLDRLARTFPIMGTSENVIQVVPMYVGKEAKREAFNRFKAENREGVVFKRLNAPFTAGRPNSGGDMLKFKFYATASVRVSSRCRICRIGTKLFVSDRATGKRSVGLELLEGAEGSTFGTWVDVGNVTIPPNKEIPPVNSVIEVRYLYAFRGGKLFQTTYLEPRDDIDQEECLTTQLKYKREED